MEGQDGDHQHNHRSTLDRQCPGIHGTGVFGQIGRTGRERSGYGARGVDKFSRLRRGSTVADNLRCQRHHRKAEGSASRMASFGTCGHDSRFFRADGQSAQSPHCASFYRLPAFQRRTTADLERRSMVPREDVGSLDQKFKKTYLDEKYSLEELEVKFAQWENLMRQLFIRKR